MRLSPRCWIGQASRSFVFGYPRCTARTGSETSWVLPSPKNDQPNRLEVSRTVGEAGVIPVSSFLYAPYGIRIVQSHLPQAFDRLSSLKSSGSSLSNYGLCDNLFTGFGHHRSIHISWVDGWWAATRSRHFESARLIDATFKLWKAVKDLAIMKTGNARESGADKTKEELDVLVSRLGLEPRTLALKGRCSTN